jgi:hypothetical protein
VPSLACITEPKATTLTIRGASRLDSVGLTLADCTSFKHGGTGGTEVSLALGASELWTEVELCRDQKSGTNTTRNLKLHQGCDLLGVHLDGCPT